MRLGRTGIVFPALIATACFNPNDAPANMTLASTGQGSASASDTTDPTGEGGDSTQTQGRTSAPDTSTVSDSGTGTATAATSDATASSATATDGTTATGDGTSTGSTSTCPNGQPPAGTVSYAVATLPANLDGSFGPIASADIDADGNLDVVVLAPSTGTMQLMLGDGDGNFETSTVSLAPNGFPDAVALGAISDNAVDMVVGMDGPAELWVYRGSGDGNFGMPTTYSTPTNALDLGDFNGDDVLDVVVINGSSLAIRLGQAQNELFGPQTDIPGPAGNRIIAVDFNADSDLDIVAAGVPFDEVRMFAGHGDGSFTELTSLVVGANVSSFGVADFDADGRPDLVVSTSGGDLRIHYGLANGTISATGTNVFTGEIQSIVHTADVDLDGIPDVITQGGVVTNVWFSNGDRTFAAPITTACAGPPSTSVVGDFNHDCVTDLVSTDANGSICTLMSID